MIVKTRNYHQVVADGEVTVRRWLLPAPPYVIELTGNRDSGGHGYAYMIAHASYPGALTVCDPTRDDMCGLNTSDDSPACWHQYAPEERARQALASRAIATTPDYLWRHLATWAEELRAQTDAYAPRPRLTPLIHAAAPMAFGPHIHAAIVNQAPSLHHPGQLVEYLDMHALCGTIVSGVLHGDGFYRLDEVDCPGCLASTTWKAAFHG